MALRTVPTRSLGRLSTTPTVLAPTSKVNLCCGQCHAQIGIFENEWLHMTDSYARSDHKGTHFGTAVGERLVVVPANAAAEGCTVAEVTCLDCKNTVGRRCMTAPRKAQEHLIGEYFYKLSRAYLKDSRTNEAVNFVFLDDHAQKGSEHAGSDRRKSLAFPNGHSASHRHEPALVTQRPTDEGTPDEAPDPRDGVLALRRVVVQEAKLEKANNKIRGLEDELHYLKTELEDLRRRVNSRHPSSKRKYDDDNDDVQDGRKRPANGNRKPEHINGAYRSPGPLQINEDEGVNFSDEDQELPDIPDGLAVEGDESLIDRYASPQQNDRLIYPNNAHEDAYPSQGPAGDVVMHEVPRSGSGRDSSNFSSDRPNGEYRDVDTSSIQHGDDSEDGERAPIKPKRKKVLSDDQYRKRRLAGGSSVANQEDDHEDGELALAKPKRKKMLSDHQLHKRRMAEDVGSLSQAQAQAQAPAPTQKPALPDFIEEEDHSLWGKDAPPPRRHTTSMNWRDHFEHETEAMLEDMAAGAGDMGGELTQWAPRLPTTTKRLFQELEVLGMEQWIHRDRRSAEYLSTIRTQRKRHKDMGRPRRLEYGRWWCIRESEITATDRANPSTIENMEWRQARAQQRAEKLALEHEFPLEASEERDINPARSKKTKPKPLANKTDPNIDPQLQSATTHPNSIAATAADKVAAQDALFLEKTTDASPHPHSLAHLDPQRPLPNLGQSQASGSYPVPTAQPSRTPVEKPSKAQPASDDIHTPDPSPQSNIAIAEDTQDHPVDAAKEDELVQRAVDTVAVPPTHAAVQVPIRASPRGSNGAASDLPTVAAKGKTVVENKISTRASVPEKRQRDVQTRSRAKKVPMDVSNAQELQERDKLVEEAMEREEMGA